jgi:hypothetical protein
MSSTKYPCYGAVHIPGVPGTFANVIVEIDDATREVLAVTALDGSPLPDPTSLQPTTPPEAKPSLDTPKPKE